MPKGDVSRRSNAVRNNRNEHKKATRYTPQAAKANLILYVSEGLTIEAALEKVGRVRSTYERWRATDKDFASKVDQARLLQAAGREAPGEKMGFAEWRKKYLHTETFWHQHQWIDILEGREPRDVHPGQSYTPGRKNRILINVPPYHAKSMTLTVHYMVYRVCMNPDFRGKIVSAGQDLARQFTYNIKKILTHPDYIDLQMAYAPEGGWKQTADAWTSTEITIGGAARTASEKDPTIQALGLGGQIYGQRADLIIIDDAVLGKNVAQWEQQMTWLHNEVDNRGGPSSKVLVIGTRMAPVDLYSELMNPEHYANGKVPWTYFKSPAVLEEADDPKDATTLWPWADQPWVSDPEDSCECGTEACLNGVEQEDGTTLYPRWDGLHLHIGPRSMANASTWALVYQQSSFHDNMTFPQIAVERSTNVTRLPGLMTPDTPGHPRGGMHNMYVIGGLDPAIKGFAAIVVYAVDRTSLKRYILNARNLHAPTVKELKDEMKSLTTHYDINEWRVEKNGLLQFFSQEEELRRWMQNNNILFREHQTGSNKWDPTFGIAGMGALFGEYERETDSRGRDAGEWRTITEPQIELPRVTNAALRALVHQLITWTPETDPKRVPCDLVMALWFAETRAKEMTTRGAPGQKGLNPFKNALRFTSARDRKPRF